MTDEGPAIKLMRERVEIGVPVPTDIARCVLAELDHLRSSVAAARALADEWDQRLAGTGVASKAAARLRAILSASSLEESPQ